MKAREALNRITRAIEEIHSIPVGDAETLSEAQLAIKDLSDYIEETDKAEYRMTDSYAIGEIIREKRRERGLSKKKVAAVAHVEPSLIGGWERGYSDITVNDLIKITREINIDIMIRLPGKQWPNE